MKESIYLLTIGLFLGTVLLIFAMRYGAAVLQARARTQGAAPNEAVLQGLAAIESRLSGIEKILKDVG